MKKCDNTSVRPKVRNKHSEKPVGEPLDKQTVVFQDRDRIDRHYPALHIKFSHALVFAKYSSPPFRAMADLRSKGQDLDNNILVKKWMENTNAFEDMIKTLLRLQYIQFWSTLVYEKSVQICLESYLRFAPRVHNPDNCLLTDAMRTQIKRVHSLVFNLYQRICSLAESKVNFMSESTFGSLLYDNYLIDVPKIIDLCVIYFNSDFGQSLSQMLSTVLQCQPKYEEDLLKSCCDISNALNLLRSKVGIDDNQFQQTNRLSQLQWHDLRALLHQIADIAMSLGSLIQTLPQTSQLFRRAAIDRTVVDFYNKVLPSLQNELNSRLSSFDNDLITEQTRRHLLISRSYLIITFRKIIENSFLNILLDKNNSENGSKLCLIDELIECLTSASFERSFIFDYCLKYPVEKDLSELAEHSDRTQFDAFDKTRVDYLKNVIQSSISSAPKSQSFVIYNQTKVNGFAPIEDINENDVELESSIQYIREIMPELGSGFVEMCLIHYNYDNETVLNAILENNLPKQLSDLDRSLDKIEKNVRNSLVNQRNERTELIATNACLPEVPEVIQNRQNVFNNDEFDIFRNKNVDLTRIHSGKRDKSVTNLADEDKQKIMSFHYKQVEEEENRQNDGYDDEYDDTYEDDTQIDLRSDQLSDELETNAGNKAEDERDGAPKWVNPKPHRTRGYHRSRYHK